MERRREIPASLKPKLPELSDQDDADAPPRGCPFPAKVRPRPGPDGKRNPDESNKTVDKHTISLDKLIGVLDKLLDPDSGCPWDLKQTPDTVRMYLLEETYELLDAVESGQPNDIREEIGDCLFLLCFLTRLYERRGLFDLASVIGEAADKMIARHPHIFTRAPNLESAEDVRAQWHQIKNKEKKKKKVSRLGGVPRHLPSLLRTHRLTERAGQVGFDWSSASAVFETLDMEIQELKAAVEPGDSEAVLAEMGDVLFTAANLGRHLKINPEDALRRTNDRFLRRFEYIEKSLEDAGKSVEETPLEEMDELWDEAKSKGL